MTVTPMPGTIVLEPLTANGGVLARHSDGTEREYAEAGNAVTISTARLDGMGGRLLFAPGDYHFRRPGAIDRSGVELAGTGDISLASDGWVDSVILVENASRFTMRDLSVVSGASDHLGGPCVEIIGPRQGGIGEGYRFERVELHQHSQNQRGLKFTNRGAPWRRLRFRDVRIKYSARQDLETDHNCQGLLLDSGSSLCEDLVADALEIDGFHTGLDTGGTGRGNEWSRVRLDKCEFRNARGRGARFYHCGEMQLTACGFYDSDAGAWFDCGANQWELVVQGCKFIGNRQLAAYTEEWRRCIFDACVVARNGRGLWLSSGHRSIVSSSTICDNGGFGISTDPYLEIPATHSRVPYALSHPAQIRGLAIKGTTIMDNAGDGLELAHVAGVHVDGSTIAGNAGVDVRVARHARSVLFTGGAVGSIQGKARFRGTQKGWDVPAIA